MSWLNPSQDEAEEAYYSSKSKYASAAGQKSALQQKVNDYVAERTSTQSTIDSCKNDKINFEERIADIAKIIGMLEGSEGVSVLGQTLTDVISKNNSVLTDTQSSFMGCMVSPDIPAASLEESFRCKSVEEEVNSSSALEEFRAEKVRLEQAVEDLNNQIASLSANLETLSKNIAMCNAGISSAQKTMISSAFDMSHYRMYM